MAKKRNTTRRAAAATRTAGKSKIISFIILVLAFVYIVTSLALGSWNPINWRLKKDTITPVGAIEVEDNTVAVDNDGNQMNEDTVYAMPRSIMFTSRAQTPSVKIRASIKPATADDKRVIWSSSNPNSVTVIPDEDDSLTATVTCLDNLSDGVVYITCTSVENPDAKAVCRIDYLVNGSDLELSGHFDGFPSELVFGNSYTAVAYFSTVEPGVGTLIGDTDNIQWGLQLKSEFITVVDNYLSAQGFAGPVNLLSYNDCSFDSIGETLSLFFSPFECFYNGNCNEVVFNNAFKLAMRDCSTHATLTIYADYVYDGKKYGSYETSMDVKFSLTGIWIAVDDVELDEDNIVFGT